MVFDRCRNVRVKGLTIDYDPLAYTEARIVALPPDKSFVEFEIIAGYPENTLEQRIEIYDPATGELRRTDAGWSDDFQPAGPHRYRIAKHKGYRYRPEWDTEQVGDILVTTNKFPAHAGGHAVELSQCVGLKLEDITLYTSPCFGFLEHACDGSTYLHCKIDRRAAADDPVQRGFPRMRSLTADAFHSDEALRGPAIIGCTAKFQGDDCVNIHGSYHFVMACGGKPVARGGDRADDDRGRAIRSSSSPSRGRARPTPRPGRSSPTLRWATRKRLFSARWISTRRSNNGC